MDAASKDLNEDAFLKSHLPLGKGSG